MEYRIWDWILARLNVSKSVFRCHYHKEGVILALRRHRVECIELQHGLIAHEDIFYLFPSQVKKVRERALFADRIWVYGEYWNRLLCEGAEYEPRRIRTVGYYNYIDPAAGEEKPVFSSFIKGRKVVLVASQTGSHEAFVAYTAWLAAQKVVLDENWAILLKPHPNEPVELFASLKSLPNVLLITENIDFVLRYSNLVISCYSTVLYDAKRYNVPAYSLYIPVYKDYIRNYTENGVSELLMPGELPGSGNSGTGKDASYYYEKFDAQYVGAELMNRSTL